MRLTSRTRSIPKSPIGAHAHLLDQVPADRPLLDLSQGAPGFPPAPEVSARMAAVAHAVDGSRYSPIRGLPHVRQAVLADPQSAYEGGLELDDICITTGCNQAFAHVVSALAEPGDEIILIEPYYFNHDMWLGLDGLTPVYLRPANGLIPTAAELEAVITDRTRAVVVVTPGNPTGYVASPEEIEAVAEVAQQHGFALILDETYRSFVPGASPHSLFSRPGWRDTVVSLHSFSKDLAIPGCRVGAIVGSSALIDEVAKIIDCVTICPPRIGQEAVHAGLTEAQAWRAAKVVEIAEKQHRFETVFAATPGGFELSSAGAYYGWVRHPFSSMATPDLVEALLIEQGVLTIPGTAFMGHDAHMIRFSFANAEVERLDELGERLTAFADGRGVGTPIDSVAGWTRPSR